MIKDNYINQYLKQTQEIYGDKLFLKIKSSPKDSNVFEHSLDEYCNSINMCQECQLGKTRKKFVFGVGDKNADLLLVGEAPGEKEDLEGRKKIFKENEHGEVDMDMDVDVEIED